MASREQSVCVCVGSASAQTCERLLCRFFFSSLGGVVPFFQSARDHSRFSRNCPLARVFFRWAFLCLIFPQVYFLVFWVNFPFTGNFIAITVPGEFTSITPPLAGCRAKTVGPSVHGCLPGGRAHRGDAPPSWVLSIPPHYYALPITLLSYSAS